MRRDGKRRRRGRHGGCHFLDVSRLCPGVCIVRNWIERERERERKEREREKNPRFLFISLITHFFSSFFLLRLRFASRESGTNRAARSVRSRARIANLKKNVPPPLPLPPPLFVHSRARSHWSRAFWKGASRRRFLGCEKSDFREKKRSWGES